MELVPAISDLWWTPGWFARYFFEICFGEKQDEILSTGETIFDQAIYGGGSFSFGQCLHRKLNSFDLPGRENTSEGVLSGEDTMDSYAF
jgi:hypothetical protein